MAMTIGTNIFSENAQRNLRKTATPLQTTIQRLTSGMRISSAKDDAAGLAISTRMQRQITGLTVSMRNANDGVSFAQTAEGAMEEMTAALQRIYELANQAASYNTRTDRGSMNEEVSELISELNRVVSQTRYNGEQILNQASSIDVQVGVEAREVINISTSNVSPDSMGVSTTYSSTIVASNVAYSGFLTTTGSLSSAASLGTVDLGDALSSADLLNNSKALIDRINLYTSQHGVTAFGFGNSLVATAGLGSGISSGHNVVVDKGFLTVNGTTIGSFTASTVSSATVANMMTAINEKSGATGVVANVVYGSVTGGSGAFTSGALLASGANGSTGRLVLSNTTGAGISVNLNTAVANGSVMAAPPMKTSSVSANQNGKIIFNSSYTTTSVQLDDATNGSTTYQVFGLGIGTAVSGCLAIGLTQTSVNDVKVTDTGFANVAIVAAKTALETFNSERAKLGAKLNRLESTVRNLDNVRENIKAARGRIMDADYAEESANFAKLQILQQAGISMLSQANQLPQQVLSLLGR